jgi:putative DNA primase/helicase
MSEKPRDPKVVELAAHRNKPPPPPPVIRIVNGFMHETATLGESALIDSALPIYQRGPSLVRPVWHEVPASRGRTTIAAGLAGLNSAGMTDRLSRAAEWERYDARAKDWRQIDPPEKVAATILSRFGEWRFPSIAGVITAPTLRPDGSLLTEPGYDRATRLFHVADNGLDVTRHLPPNPTLAHAEAALNDLLYVIKGFPVVTATDTSVALSGLISPVVRGACPVAPMHALRASTAGTGKTYFVDVASAIATGRPCPVATVAKSEEETEKRLGGLLLAGFPLICLDNVNGELGGDLLAQAVERPVIQIRPLGGSDIIEVESRSSIFATGNALRLRGDMTRRGLICNLDAGVERPELRQFEFDPVELVLTKRAECVAAVLTIVLAHAAAGYPGADTITPLASFQEWSRLVRSALIWLGCADPCVSMEQAREDDPELIDLMELLAAWKAEIGVNSAQTVAEVLEMVGERRYADSEPGAPAEWKYPKMREIIQRLAMTRGTVDARRFGNVLRAKEGRIVGGYRIMRAGGGGGGVLRWQLRAV